MDAVDDPGHVLPVVQVRRGGVEYLENAESRSALMITMSLYMYMYKMCNYTCLYTDINEYFICMEYHDYSMRLH